MSASLAAIPRRTCLSHMLSQGRLRYDCFTASKSARAATNLQTTIVLQEQEHVEATRELPNAGAKDTPLPWPTTAISNSIIAIWQPSKSKELVCLLNLPKFCGGIAWVELDNKPCAMIFNAQCWLARAAEHPNWGTPLIRYFHFVQICPYICKLHRPYQIHTVHMAWCLPTNRAH